MAEENKNIDKFFSDRLATNQVEEKDWNIPSDDIWLAAKPHFVKKEKSKKRFIFWSLGAILMASVLLAYGLTKPIKKEENIIATNKTSTNNTATFKNESPNTEFRKTNDKSFSEDNKSVISSIKSIPQPSNNSAVPNVASTPLIKKQKPSSTINSTNTMAEDYVKTLANKDYRNTSELGESYPPQIINTVDNSISEISSEGTASAMSSAEIKPHKLNEVTVLSFPEAIGRRKMLVQSVDQKESYGELMFLATKPISQTPKYEVGISHSEYLARLYLEAASSIDEEAIVLDLKYSLNNMNLSGRKWINNKFSYRYGVNATQLGLDADLEFLDTLDQDISNFVQDKYASATRSNIETENLEVELLDGFTLLEGDVIKVKGLVNLNLVALQFPLMLDYHIYKNKMEYLFGAGISFEALHVTQEAIDISIFKDDERVNKTLISERASELLFDYSAYASVEAKYHLNKNWNVGLSTKIALIDPNFSYAEIGIYHRWHK